MIQKERIVSWIEDVCAYFDMPIPEWSLTDKKNGQAKRVRDTEGVHTTISLPRAMLTHSEAFAKYYVVHELTHLATNNPKHDEAFKETETNALARVYNIGIKYSRSFPKYLFDIDSSPRVVLWGTSDKIIGRGLCLTEINL